MIWRGLTEAFEDENYFPGAFQVLGEKSAVAKGNNPPGLEVSQISTGLIEWLAPREQIICCLAHIIHDGSSQNGEVTRDKRE